MWILARRKKTVKLLVAFGFVGSQLFPTSATAADRGISLPDDKTGHQIQIIYVETPSSDGSNFDSTGQIAEWVLQIQSWLQKQTGKNLIFDTYIGNLDISYLQFNRNITYEGNEVTQLIQMYRGLNPTTYFGKTLAFVVNQKRPVGEDLCGWAGPRKGYALILPNLTFPNGGQCRDYPELLKVNNGFSFEAQSLLHEIVHSYGVEDHVCADTTDLMQGSPECKLAGVTPDTTKPVTFDLSGRYYFRGDKAGVDLTKLKVWSDGSGMRRPDMGDGTCWSGELCSVEVNTFDEQGIVQLQVRSGAKWAVVQSAKGTLSNCAGCRKFTYANSAIFTKAGVYEYRIFKLATKKYRSYTGPSTRIRVLQ